MLPSSSKKNRLGCTPSRRKPKLAPTGRQACPAGRHPERGIHLGEISPTAPTHRQTPASHRPHCACTLRFAQGLPAQPRRFGSRRTAIARERFSARRLASPGGTRAQRHRRIAGPAASGHVHQRRTALPGFRIERGSSDHSRWNLLRGAAFRFGHRGCIRRAGRRRDWNLRRVAIDDGRPGAELGADVCRGAAAGTQSGPSARYRDRRAPRSHGALCAPHREGDRGGQGS